MRYTNPYTAEAEQQRRNVAPTLGQRLNFVQERYYKVAKRKRPDITPEMLTAQVTAYAKALRANAALGNKDSKERKAAIAAVDQQLQKVTDELKSIERQKYKENKDGSKEKTLEGQALDWAQKNYEGDRPEDLDSKTEKAAKAKANRVRELLKKQARLEKRKAAIEADSDKQADDEALATKLEAMVERPKEKNAESIYSDNYSKTQTAAQKVYEAVAKRDGKKEVTNEDGTKSKVDNYDNLHATNALIRAQEILDTLHTPVAGMSTAPSKIEKLPDLKPESYDFVGSDGLAPLKELHEATKATNEALEELEKVENDMRDAPAGALATFTEEANEARHKVDVAYNRLSEAYRNVDRSILSSHKEIDTFSERFNKLSKAYDGTQTNVTYDANAQKSLDNMVSFTYVVRKPGGNPQDIPSFESKTTNFKVSRAQLRDAVARYNEQNSSKIRFAEGETSGLLHASSASELQSFFQFLERQAPRYEQQRKAANEKSDPKVTNAAEATGIKAKVNNGGDGNATSSLPTPGASK